MKSQPVKQGCGQLLFVLLAFVQGHHAQPGRLAQG